ncbi:small subunit processome component 20 homolog [Acanthaster planci]|uniref:Small subunit processome component 20 homolog n=1 Tax=Acanthaster planci TaxID=133434 RepID=A0A8B8A267_ACAPL|nr:small subunit processome component 20 homolog [Acanthaster planci]
MCSFEKDVLHPLLHFCHAGISRKTPSSNQAILYTLCSLVLHKQSPITDGSVLESHALYILDFSLDVYKSQSKSKKSKRQLSSFPEYLLSLLDCNPDSLGQDNMVSVLWAALVCLPNVRPLDNEKVIAKLKGLITTLWDVAESQKDDTVKDMLLYLLSTAVCTLLQCGQSEPTPALIQEHFVWNILRATPTSAHVLLIGDLYITQLVRGREDSVLCAETLQLIFPALQPNLSAPYKKVRMLTLRILSHFPVELPSIPDLPTRQVCVFQLCLEAELVPATVEDYREKQKLLQKLSYDAVQPNVPIGNYKEVALRYLIGLLYINFQLLWQPIMELIKSHAYGMDKKSFWSVYSDHLLKVATLLETSQTKTTTNPGLNDSLEDLSPNVPDLAALFRKMQVENVTGADRPDHWNVRQLMWKAMALFADRAEGRSRELVPLVFRFIENEYHPSNVNNAPTQDIRVRTCQDVSVDQTEDSGETEEDLWAESQDGEEKEDTERTPKLVGKRTKQNKAKGSVSRALVTHLQLFSRFKDPKSMYKEPQLRKLYFDLLSNNFPDIQKVVLSCLMTYNHPYLTPYRDSLDALMEDNKFRETLVQFSIDETTGVVAANHREGLLPILLRLLYGKMMSKTGPGTQGKSGGAVRRSTILRFIAGSSSNELSVFLDLVLEPCRQVLKDDCYTTMTEYLDSLSPSTVIPLKKQQSMLDTIGVIFSKLGHRIAPFATSILHLVTTLLASYAKLLDQRSQIQTYAVGQLKRLRQLALLRLAEFFSVFEHHPLSASEIDCIFEAAVWPQIDSLANECLASPTPLLKLIFVWSKYSRFHPLLAKHHPTKPSCTILPSVTSLLSASTVSASVVNVVMEIVEHLLLEEESGMEDGEEVDDLEVNDLIDVAIESKQFADPPSFGTKLLFPHVPAILQYLSSSVHRCTHTKEDRRGLPMKDLNILSKISLYISDPEQSTVLVSLLLPFLRRTSEKHETTELDILHTVRNVIKLCRNPSDFLGPLSLLFYRLTFRQSRAALCEVFAAMAQNDPTLGEVARLMKQLNSWDRKHVEEPDYAYRLAGFKLANERLVAMETINMAFVTPIIYNCFYMIMKIDDLSMRDNSVHFLKELLQKLATVPPNSQHFNGIVFHKYAPAIRDALRLKAENARHEMIGLLSDIVRLFPDHPQFQCMTVLHDTDVEKDFFENIRHIQHHRRMRALRHLALHARQGDLAYSALYQFLLPMATALIFDQVLAAKNPNLVIEAIGAVGAIAGQLPWRCYYLILQQYLRLIMRSLDQQKTAVRLVVAVLDGFHFDLSLSEGVESVQVGKTSTKPENESSEGSETVDKKSCDEHSDDEDENTEPGDEKDTEEDEEGENEDVEEQVSHGDDSECKSEVSLATKIHRIIVASILPKLHKTLTKKVTSEEHHKKARPSLAEDEEVLRVPIALAMVKLLQALPSQTLHANLPGILLKVCQMLKSRAKDVRDVSRDTLVKILASLGVGYFPFILKELRHALTRGYQLHVLSFTLHALLHSALPTLKPGDLDTSMDSVIEVINKELFGNVADEKEVEGIVGKLPEARSIKGYDCYEMIAKVVGQSSLTRLLIPLKEILETNQSHKVVRKATDVLRHVTMGLIANPGIPVDAMLIYIHGLATETIPFLNPSDSDRVGSQPPPDPRTSPASCYLLLPTPKRGGLMPKVSKKTNMHLIVEFGLQLLNMNLKRSKLSPSNQQHLQMLDPFIRILMDSLTSKFTKVTVVALRCVTWMLRYPLPSISRNATRLTKILFKILHTHATAGAAKGANFDIVVNCFKAVTVLVRDVKQHTIDEKQLQVLLTYAEEDMHDHTRQATAFGLLKAILSRKLIVPEMHGVMKKVAKLSIMSESPSVRLQCRQVVLNFLLDYPLGSQLEHYLQFFVIQLNFDLETGRESTLEMLATIFSSFPQKTLETYAGMFFIPMATRLINDDSAKCRKITALAIKSLLQKLRVDKRDELFTMARHWLQDDKPAHRRLASQLCGIFVDAEEKGFQRRLDGMLPQIEKLVRPDELQKDGISEMETEEVSLEERHADHMLFNVLSALAKMIKHCSVIGNKAYTETMNAIWDSIQSHLLHPHAWVRLVSAQLFGDLFASKQPNNIAGAMLKAASDTQTDHSPVSEKQTPKRTKRKRKAEETEEERSGAKGRIGALEYPLNHGQDVVRELVFRFCRQLHSTLLNKDLGDQVVRNLVFLGKVIRCLHPEDSENQTEESSDSGDEEENNISEGTSKIPEESVGTGKEKNRTGSQVVTDLTWITKKVCRIAAWEAAKTPKQTLRRTCTVKWLAAMSVDVGGEQLPRYLQLILKPMCREIGDQKSHTDNDLRLLCQEALDLIKGLVGLETFSHAYTNVQRVIAQTRIQRKHKRALQAVADPVQAARRKEKKQQNKKVAKKRRIQQLRPTYQMAKKAKIAGGM